MFRGARVALGGAGQGVGAACARLLARQGARLLLCARSGVDVEALAEELRRGGTDAWALAADLGTDQGAESFAREAQQRLGGVDIGLICAGVSQRPQWLTELGREELLAQLQGNTVAPTLACLGLARGWQREDAGRDLIAEDVAREATAKDGPHEPVEVDAPGAQRPRRDRQLLVLSSLVTHRSPLPKAGPYTAAKAALESLVRTLAEELWPAARINALCLGPVATRMHLQAGTPRAVSANFPSADEVAPLVLELLGPRGRGLSGRCVDAEALGLEPEAALWADGRLAGLQPLQPPPSLALELAASGPLPPEAEPGRAPSPLVRAALRASASALQRYPHGAEQLAARLAELHRVPPDCVLLSGGGATELLERALRALAAPGEEVVSPFPTFEVLSALSSRTGLRHRPVPSPRNAERLFSAHSATSLLAALSPRTRILYVATPDNPTGIALELREERALCERLPASVALLLDEAWSLEVPGDEVSPGSRREPADGAPLIRLRSLSKLFGLAGLRIGYALATPALADQLRRLELPFPLGTPQLAAALAALDELPRARRVARLLLRRRARLSSALRLLGLAVSEGRSPLILLRDPRPAARSAPLAFALRAAGLAVQEAHWDDAALALSVGTPTQDRRTVAALGRALDAPRERVTAALRSVQGREPCASVEQAP